MLAELAANVAAAGDGNMAAEPQIAAIAAVADSAVLAEGEA